MNKKNIQDQYKQLTDKIKDKYIQLLALRDDTSRHDEHEWKEEVKELKAELLDDVENAVDSLVSSIKNNKELSKHRLVTNLDIGVVPYVPKQISRLRP